MAPTTVGVWGRSVEPRSGGRRCWQQLLAIGSAVLLVRECFREHSNASRRHQNVPAAFLASSSGLPGPRVDPEWTSVAGHSVAPWKSVGKSSRAQMRFFNPNPGERETPEGQLGVVTVSQPEMKEFSVGWFENDTVIDIKKVIETKLRIPPSKQKMYVDGLEVTVDEEFMLDACRRAFTDKMAYRMMKRLPPEIEAVANGTEMPPTLEVIVIDSRQKAIVGYEVDPNDPNAPIDWARKLLTQSAFEEDEQADGVLGGRSFSVLFWLFTIIVGVYFFFQISEDYLRREGYMPPKPDNYNQLRYELTKSRFTDPMDPDYKPYRPYTVFGQAADEQGR